MNARLYKLNQNPLQSGIAKNEFWILEVIEERKNIKNKESSIIKSKLTFDNKNSALKYIEKNAIQYKIIYLNEKEFKTKNYNKNFL